ncbi:unnamed protein product, partial [Dovyalis caffra]
MAKATETTILCSIVSALNTTESKGEIYILRFHHERKQLQLGDTGGELWAEADGRPL